MGARERLEVEALLLLSIADEAKLGGKANILKLPMSKLLNLSDERLEDLRDDIIEVIVSKVQGSKEKQLAVAY